MGPTPDSPSSRRALLVGLLAWALPGAGHFALGRRGRAAWFAALTCLALLTGLALAGNLHRPVSGQPLTYLATLGAMGMGLVYFVLEVGLGYAGDPTAAGYEYGTAFLLTAGLMNLLLALDAWDIANGRKD